MLKIIVLLSIFTIVFLFLFILGNVIHYNIWGLYRKTYNAIKYNKYVYYRGTKDDIIYFVKKEALNKEPYLLSDDEQILFFKHESLKLIGHLNYIHNSPVSYFAIIPEYWRRKIKKEIYFKMLPDDERLKYERDDKLKQLLK